MATASNPIQNQEGLKYSQNAKPTSKLSDLLTSAHQNLSAVRDKYADMVNNLADSITAHANLTPEAEPIKKDLGTTVRAGMGVFGVPVPPTREEQASTPGAYQKYKGGPIESSEPMLSTLPGKPGSGEEGSVKIPKGQMKPAKIMAAIEDAATKNQSLHMTYHNPEWDEPKQYHVEPYSYRGEGNQTLMAYDKLGKGIKAFKLDNIVNATPSGQNFKPRWEVEIAPAKENRPTPEEDFQKELREGESKPVPHTGPMYPK